MMLQRNGLSRGMNAAHLWGKEVRHFFQAEQDAANGGSESHGDARSTCGAEYLSSFACVDVRRETKDVVKADSVPSLFSYLAK
jgi:hypothetical protein